MEQRSKQGPVWRAHKANAGVKRQRSGAAKSSLSRLAEQRRRGAREASERPGKRREKAHEFRRIDKVFRALLQSTAAPPDANSGWHRAALRRRPIIRGRSTLHSCFAGLREGGAALTFPGSTDIFRRRPPGKGTMTEAKVQTVRAADLRRLAASSMEPERQRKMLALAEHFEQKEAEQEERRARRGS